MTGFLEVLAKAIIQETSFLEKTLEKKLEELGREAISGILAGSPIGTGMAAAGRVGSAMQTFGTSGTNALRNDWLNAIRPSAGPGTKILASVERALGRYTRPSDKKVRGGTWHSSRQQWLDESWKHNWRSQPRDARGRWVPGRLTYPLAVQPKVSRRIKRIRQMRRTQQKAGRKIAKTIVASWGRNNGN
jgi:hypothetical protein